MNIFSVFSRLGSTSSSGYHHGSDQYHQNTSFYIPDSIMYASRKGYASGRGGAFWLFSLIIGLIFVVLSVLLIVYPELLAFFFAGIMLFAGLFFISTALFLRSVSNGGYLKRN